MRNRFDRQLEELNVELIEMGSLCEQVISLTYEVMKENGTNATQEIIEKDSEIDLKEQEIESLCLKILLQQQPVAKDLRQVSAALKMITDMERIGDQASDIAEIIQVTNLSIVENSVPLQAMAEATMKMVTESIDAYVKRDLKIAQQVINYDDIVDDLFVKLRKQLINMIGDNPENGEYAMDLLMIGKYYERIGDHATNIAEWVEFSITGHHRGEE